MLALTELDGMYHLDPAHSSIAFVARHAGIAKVRGTFESFHGWALIDGAQPEHSALLVSVKVSSINSRDANRDGHLRSPDFFDVARFPAITFVGTDFRITGENLVEVDGDLTVRDVTRPVRVSFEYEGGAKDPFGNERIGFTGSTTISRADFGLTWNAVLETGGVLVSDAVKLEFEVSAIKQADAPH
ncbi:YceI family protein [Propioniciclava sp. MC1595]|uniref:YceI family protein n=1 Tax=Propioniciclava sp. MC1595 TaxID=2760308 RepID=UPI001FB727ED|nr:YceI family protein [Propioniciclava sp. MC1595]